MSPPTDSTASAISCAGASVGALEQQVLEEVAGARERVGSRRASRCRPRSRPRPSAGRAAARSRPGVPSRGASADAAPVVIGTVIGSVAAASTASHHDRHRRAAARRDGRRRDRRRPRPRLGGTEVAELLPAWASQGPRTTRPPTSRLAVAAASPLGRSDRGPAAVDRRTVRPLAATLGPIAAGPATAAGRLAAARRRRRRATARACPSCRCRRPAR